ncbi:MAG: HNH endonuclease, partial [Actinomycetota bacterium]|nr:HNH endonuclease [Actinomycetota bacterium]
RLVTPALRAAVCARDLRCVFSTCDRASNWCDVHHVTHWANGGETNIDNLVLLCRHHHVLVHEAGWTLTGLPGALRFFRPDGTELGSEPPPRPPIRNPFLTAEPRPTLPPGGLLPIILNLPRLRAP